MTTSALLNEAKTTNSNSVLLHCSPVMTDRVSRSTVSTRSNSSMYISVWSGVLVKLWKGDLNYIIPGRAQCSVALQHWTDYKKDCVTTSHHGVWGLHVVHLTGLKINHVQSMEKQSSHFRMKCLWRVCMPFYRGNWMMGRVWWALRLMLCFLLTYKKKCVLFALSC